MKYSKLALLIILLLVGCEDSKLESASREVDETSRVQTPSEEAINESKIDTVGVSGDLIRSFIKGSEFLGLQKLEPDYLFFTHMAAPGFSIQLEGKSPDEMTGAMIDISYVSENFSMGRGNINGLLGVLLKEGSRFEANEWITKQFVDSEFTLREGLTPLEDQFEIDNLDIIFFPPTSLNNLKATILISAHEERNISADSSKNSSTPVPQDKKDEELIVRETDLSINDLDDNGVTKLARASGEGNLREVKDLLNNGADPNLYKDYGEPPLLWAVRSNQDNVVKILLDAGANPNVRSMEGLTPLTIAKSEGANIIMELLLEYGGEE